MKAKDLTGKRFERLTVISRAENRNGQAAWNCICDCGKHTVVRSYQLTHGLIKSCGCYAADKTKDRSITHGESRTRLYSIWRSMIKHCYQKTSYGYDNYGGRGIRVCDVWKNSYESFRDWAVLNGYNDNLTIDRIDNESGYCPENCRFVTMLQQENNRRNNRKITYKDVSLNASEWCRITGIPKTTFLRAVDRYGEGKAVEFALCRFGENSERRRECGILLNNTDKTG